MKQCRRGYSLDPKTADIGMVSQEPCGGVPRWAGSGMLEINSKTLYLTKGGLLLFFQGLQ